MHTPQYRYFSSPRYIFPKFIIFYAYSQGIFFYLQEQLNTELVNKIFVKKIELWLLLIDFSNMFTQEVKSYKV